MIDRKVLVQESKVSEGMQMYKILPPRVCSQRINGNIIIERTATNFFTLNLPALSGSFSKQPVTMRITGR